MRIGQVLAYISGQYGGPPAVAKALAAEYEKKGHEVCTWSTVNAEAISADTGLRSARVFKRQFPVGWYVSSELAKDFQKQAADFDIVHIHEVWSYPQWACANKCRNLRVPFMISPHGNLKRTALQRKGWKKKLYWKTFGKKFLSKAACLHALTPREAQSLRDLGMKNDIAVIPNGVDADYYSRQDGGMLAEQKWPELKNKRVILYLGRLSGEKGLDVLLPAFSELQKKNNFDDTHLVLAGPDHRGYASNLNYFLKDQKLTNTVLFTGHIEGELKKSLMAKSCLFTLASHSEGFSVSVLENLAVGNPVLISHCCDFEQVQNQKAGLCVPDTLPGFIEGMENILNLNTTQYDQMSSNAAQLVKNKYSWTRIANMILEVYSAIINRSEIPYQY